MLYTSDWHIHTEGSYDARKGDYIPIPELLESARAQGITRLGISDHINNNGESFLRDGDISRAVYEKNKCPGFYFGVELTPVEMPLYEHLKKYGTHSGYDAPPVGDIQPFELALTEEEILARGIQYVIAAAHWSLGAPPERDAYIREWHRQQMQMALDPRVDILGHPWWCSGTWKDEKYPQLRRLWFDDFSVIPASMHDELASALLSRDCCAEINISMIQTQNYEYTERFRTQYLEYMRYLFERGVRITYGSDLHSRPYADRRAEIEPALRAAGFREGDFSEPKFRV